MQEEVPQEEAQDGYIRRPYTLFRDGYKGYGGAIAGLIYSYSNSNKRPNATFVGSQTQIAERVGCSRSTVTRKIAKLKKEAGFTQTTLSPSGRRLPCAVYTYKPQDTGSDAYMVTNMKLYGEKEMSPSAVDVFSHIMTQQQSPVNGKSVFYGTPTTVAQALHMGVKTARKALRELYELKYVFRTQTVVNGYGTNKYEIPQRVVLKYRTPFPKKEERETVKSETETSPKRDWQKEVKDADARAERERYYAVIREEADKKVELLRARLFADVEYKAAYGESKKLEIKIASAELYGSKEEQEELRARLTEQQDVLRSAMKHLGIREQELYPKRRCRRCSDTGYLPNGRMCNCYKSNKK